MSKESENDFMAWIHQGRNRNVEANVVNNLIPEKFDTYFKLFFPIIFENENTNQAKNISYEKIAELTGVPYNESCCLRSFPDYISNYVTSSQDDEYKFIGNLESILDDGQPCIFYGFGGENVPERFTEPWASAGKINDLTNIVKAMNEFAKLEIVNFPSYVFPNDKSWLLGNIILQSGIVVLGCSEDLAKKIREQTEMEFMELKASDEYFDFEKK